MSVGAELVCGFGCTISYDPTVDPGPVCMAHNSAWMYAETDFAESAIDPPHYRGGGIETIDFIEAKELDYHLGNVVKYVSRAGKKTPDGLLDLKKALWYLERAIERRSDL